MTVALMAVLLVEVREDEEISFVRREWFEGKGEFVIGAFLLREPILFPDSIREIETGHADGRLDFAGSGCARGSFGGCVRKNLTHHIQERQAQGDAHAAEERTAGESLVFQQHKILFLTFRRFGGSNGFANYFRIKSVPERKTHRDV